MVKKPLCLYNGIRKELQAGDTLPGGGGVTVTSITVNVPYAKMWYVATVTDAGVSPSSNVMINWGAFALTDVNEPDSINFWVVPGTGNFSLYMSSNNQFGGAFKFKYFIA